MKVMMRFLGIVMLLAGSTVFAQENNNILVNQLDDNMYEVSILHDNGAILEKGVLLDGKCEGTWTRYTETGMIAAIANYSNGMKDGVWQIYSADGALSYEMVYEKNERLIAKTFDGGGETVSYRIR